MSTTHASHTVHLNLSLESAWRFLSDLSLAPYYVPGLTGCWFHPGPQRGCGASRRVQRRYGQWLDETVIDWQEGKGFVLHLHKAGRGAPFPFSEARFSYTLEAHGSGSRMTLCLDYRLRGGRLVERLLASTFERTVQQIGECLTVYYETGETQNRDFLD
ncbi:SRPBCC family protein [Ectopseudomonas khazarica]|uniref:SRPBCC family protein n=1 Tax=Ectopseudomonas khazarica TaxID=2502979 RepID=UPI002FDF0CBF